MALTRGKPFPSTINQKPSTAPLFRYRLGWILDMNALRVAIITVCSRKNKGVVAARQTPFRARRPMKLLTRQPNAPTPVAYHEREPTGLFLGGIFGLHGRWWIGCRQPASCQTCRRRENKGATALGRAAGGWGHAGRAVDQHAALLAIHDDRARARDASARTGHARDHLGHGLEQSVGLAESAARGYQVFRQKTVAARDRVAWRAIGFRSDAQSGSARAVSERVGNARRARFAGRPGARAETPAQTGHVAGRGHGDLWRYRDRGHGTCYRGGGQGRGDERG